MSRTFKKGLAAACALAMVALVGCGQRASSPPASSTQPSSAAAPEFDPGTAAGDTPAPGFTLRDQDGRLTTLVQFRGKVVVMAFVDSHCTTICPLTTQSMVEALRLLGPAAARVQLLGINANPLALRVADVANYTHLHGLGGQWRFLTGSLPQLQAVWKGYHVYVAAIHNDIDHEPIMVLIDPQGREHTIYTSQMSYAGAMPQAQVLARDIAGLLPSGPAVAAIKAAAYVPPLPPSQPATLAALGTGAPEVALGPGHPHLLVFFATWLGSPAALRSKLASLNAYAAAAGRHGWPAPVIVDETATESDVPAVRALLAGWAPRLQAPIVTDSAGRLGDGYQVQDLPWYVLTDSQGRILWHYAGWLAAADLEHQVPKVLGQK